MKAKITQKPDNSFHFTWAGKIRAFPSVQEGLSWLKTEKFSGEVEIIDDGKTVKTFPSLEKAMENY